MNIPNRLMRLSVIATTAGLLLGASTGSAQLLGTAGTYGALGASTVTNTGSTVITGNLGLSPGTAITGFTAIDSGPGLFTGTANIANALASQAQLDALTAYNTLAGLSSSFDLTGQDLGSMALTPGIYHFDTSAQLTGMLTLDALGDPNARFVFQIGSTLTTASSSVVSIVNIGEGCGPDNGLFWQVGSSATLGSDTAFAGNILAFTSISLNNGASIDDGRALAGMLSARQNVLRCQFIGSAVEQGERAEFDIDGADDETHAARPEPRKIDIFAQQILDRARIIEARPLMRPPLAILSGSKPSRMEEARNAPERGAPHGEGA